MRRRILAIGVVVAPAVALMALALAPRGVEAAPSTTRTYFIAADEVAWDYAPSGINEISGQPSTSSSSRI